MGVLASPISSLVLTSTHRETLHLLKPPPSSSFPSLSSSKPNPALSLSAFSKPLSLISLSSTPSPPPTNLTGRTHHLASNGYAATLFDISNCGRAVALAAIARDVHRLETFIASIRADSSMADEERSEAVRATVDCGRFDRRLVAVVRMVVAKKRGAQEVADVLDEFGRIWSEMSLVAVEEADVVVVSEKKMGIEQLAKVAGEVQRACGVVLVNMKHFFSRRSPRQIFDVEMEMKNQNFKIQEGPERQSLSNNSENNTKQFWRSYSFSFGISSWFSFCQVAQSSVGDKADMVYEIGELFELGIQLTYLLILLGLLGLGTFFVIRQVLVRRELDLSAKELQEQVRSGDATATEYFELGAVMLRRKFYPAATKFLQQAIEKWDRDDQDLAQVYNALGVSYVRDNKLDKGIAQFEAAVKLQPGYVTAWNNMGDAYEKKKNLKMALKAFEEVLLFDPNNKIARPRRDALRQRVELYKGVPLKSEER